MLKRMFVVVLVVCAPLPLAAQSVYELVGINAPNGNAALVKHVELLAGSTIIGVELLTNDLRTIFPKVTLYRGPAVRLADAVMLREFVNVRAPGRRRITLTCVPTRITRTEDVYLAVSWPASDGVRAYGDGAALPAIRHEGSNGCYVAVGSEGELQELMHLDLAVRLLLVEGSKAETEEESDVPATAFLGSTQTQGGLAVHFGVAIGGPVTLTMYDVMGRAVRRLQGDDQLGPGRYVRTWDGVDDTGQRVAAGVYLVRLQTAAGVLTHKAVLIR